MALKPAATEMDQKVYGICVSMTIIITNNNSKPIRLVDVVTIQN
jgi:hypothetical protein